MTPIVLILILITLLVFTATGVYYVCQHWNYQKAKRENEILSTISTTNTARSSEPELIAISKLEQKPLPGKFIRNYYNSSLIVVEIWCFFTKRATATKKNGWNFALKINLYLTGGISHVRYV